MIENHETHIDPNRNNQSKSQEYSKKSLEPLVNLFHNRRENLTPYMSAIGTGLEGAIKAIEGNQNPDDASKYISGWFKEAQGWFQNIQEKFKNKDPQELMSFLETESKTRPALMFSMSYVAGLIFGRLTKYTKIQ